MMLEPDMYIDARNYGSVARLINHSCDPNCTTEKWSVNGETRVAIITSRKIALHEELTMNYQFKAFGMRGMRFGEESDAHRALGAFASPRIVEE